MNNNLKIITIGVYGFEEETFFKALLDADVDTFCDIRARRGLRGKQYAFANSKRLQARLEELGIHYFHFKALAPTQAVRDRQKAADAETGTKKRERDQLSPAFIQAYQEECLADFDANTFVEQLGPGAQVVVLFCVERAPEACHRSLVAQHLAEELGITVEHLLP